VPRGNEALIRRAYGAFAARDLAALSELAAPEVEVDTVTGVLAGRDEPYRGYEGLERYLADIAEVWRRLELFPKEFVELDTERVLVRRARLAPPRLRRLGERVGVDGARGARRASPGVREPRRRPQVHRRTRAVRGRGVRPVAGPRR
jgi:hypothetical protein